MSVTRRYFRYLLQKGGTKNALVMAIHDEALGRAATEHLPASGHGALRLLDVGCGFKPYEAMFKPYVAEHVGLDVEDTRYDAGKVDLFGSATAVPAEDASFDVVLSTSNLEHVEEPAAALREWRRVMKPGGVLFLTVPLFWHLHDPPRDFYRFTKHGLGHLCAQAGFEVVALRTLGGFWTTAATMSSYALMRFNRGPLRWLGVMHLLGALLQTVALPLEKIDRAEKWACLYLVVARKAGLGVPVPDASLADSLSVGVGVAVLYTPPHGARAATLQRAGSADGAHDARSPAGAGGLRPRPDVRGGDGQR